MIEMFEREWDRTMVETFDLKAKLDAAHEELSKALYEQQAAARVVARLQKERDDAFGEISRLQDELAKKK
jgi:pre-mRNA-processing factor 19